jgi:hypothetical protein
MTDNEIEMIEVIVKWLGFDKSHSIIESMARDKAMELLNELRPYLKGVNKQICKCLNCGEEVVNNLHICPSIKLEIEKENVLKPFIYSEE